MKRANLKRMFWWMARIVSLREGYVLSAGALIGFVVWILIDAFFHLVVDIYLTETTIRPNLNLDGKGWGFWFEIIPMRMSLFSLLTIVAVVGTLVVLFRLLVGRRSERSIRSFLLAILLVAAWLSFFSQYDQLSWAGVRFRMGRRLPELQKLGRELRDHWPEEESTLPVVGFVRGGTDYLIISNTDQLSWQTYARSTNDPFGMWALREDNGHIRVELNIQHWEQRGFAMLEFTPPEVTPGLLDLVVVTRQGGPRPFRRRLENFVRLDDNVYLAWYTW